ncbi:MAG: sensor histidine kinase [Campylobacterota bacterium]|nr:sensor histidine kinase [Campylobacterota bacterium]
MIKLLLLLSFFIFLNASSIEINYADTKYENFTIYYLEDKDKKYDIEQVKNMQFKPINNQHAFSGKTGYTWYKIELKNITHIDKEIYLHDNLAYYSKEIDIFEFSKNRLLDQNKYYILDCKDANKLYGSTLVYKTSLLPNSKKVIFIKNEPMVSNLFSLNIYDNKSSIEALVNKPFYSIVIISIMFTLAFYNATLYFFNKRKEFLIYALYMLTPAIGLLYKYGIIFDTFNLYGENTYWLNLTAILMPAFFIIFLKQVLNLNKMHKKINSILNSIILLVAIDIVLAIVIDLTFAIEVFKIVFFYSFIVMIYLGFYLFKIKHPLAQIFALAYLFYMSGMIITILAMSGAIELSFLTFHSGGIGLIIEGLLFSYLMHYNVKILEQKVHDQREVIIAKNKKAQLGEMIGAITHQWKQPLNRITSITSILEFKIDSKNNISTDELKEKISQINSNTLFLGNTIDDFKDFFNPNINTEICDIAEIIQRAISLSNDDTMTKEISIKTDLNFDKNIRINKNELLHILLNIIQNSKEAFKNVDGDIKIIKIIGYCKDNKIYIDIIDNAGGIKEETLPFIFNEHYTTKGKKSGSGLGLYLTKIILENHLQGSIEAKNIKGGAMFRIIL